MTEKDSIVFPAKLLLFGEHLIIKGGQALAIPFPNFHGQWQYSNNPIDQQNLHNFCIYLQDLDNKKALLTKLQLDRLKSELQKGLYFQSNIPLGYGAGSSGALCAAIYARYDDSPIKIDKLSIEKISPSLTKLKSILAQLESFFHGSSSGTDPLICYLQQALLLTGQEKIEIVSVPKSLKNHVLFLLDTVIQRKTAPFVNHFLERYEDPFFAKLCQSQFIPITEDAIHAFLTKEEGLLFNKWHQISNFQQQYFSKMIPEDFKSIWLDGLSGDLYKLKLCGAGGGGFILGITNDFEAVKKNLAKYSLLKVL